MIRSGKNGWRKACKKVKTMEKIIREILSKGNNVEIKQNKKGDIIILEAEKKIRKTIKVE